MFGKTGKTFIILTLCGTALVSTPALCASIWNQKSDISAIDSGNFDLAVGDKAYAAYETGGKVYLASRGPADTSWDVREVGAGSAPSVSLDNSGGVHVAYSSGGSIYESSSTNGWAPTLIAPGSYCAVRFDGTGTEHALYECNDDGDAYAELYHMTNSGSGWSDADLLFDGQYGYGSGNYFGQSGLTGTEDGYAYSLESQSWGGRASWSSKFPSAQIDGGLGTSMEVSWGQGSQLTRRAISSGADGLGFAFATGGQVYASLCTGGLWSSFIDIGAGGDASVQSEHGLSAAYTSGGNLMYYDGSAAGAIDFQGNALTGSAPILVSAPGYDFILYKTTDGQLCMLTTMPEGVVPEPASLIPFGTGLISLVGFISRRRRN